MKHYIILLGALLLCSCTKPSGPVTPTPVEPQPEPQPTERTLSKPENLAVEPSGEDVILTWKDKSYLEEGYIVTRESLSGSSKDYLIKANSESFTDQSVPTGSYTYTVRAYWHTERGEGASIAFSKTEAAQVAIDGIQSSDHMAALLLRLVSKGGAQNAEVGLLYSEGGTEGCLVYPKTLSEGESTYLLLENLEYGKTYSVKAYVTTEQGTFYSDAQNVKLKDAPTPLTLSWQKLSSAPEIELYKSSSSISGANVNLWYAVADPTKVEVRTTMASKLTTPTQYITETLSKESEVYVLTNGGYFASPASSYSYLCDRGSKKAGNVRSLSRTEAYNVTRGAFGIDSNGSAYIKWLWNDDAYDSPLPVYDGGPVLSCSKSYPCQRETFSPYNGIGGAPVLLKGGRICFDYLKSSEGKYLSNHELLQADIFASGLKAPRTAVGIKGDGKIVLLVADGRNSGGSAGLTLEDLSRVLLGLGCKDALNLDGGGSSMMCKGNEGTLLNTPSDGTERKVLTYISFCKK